MVGSNAPATTEERSPKTLNSFTLLFYLRIYAIKELQIMWPLRWESRPFRHLYACQVMRSRLTNTTLYISFLHPQTLDKLLLQQVIHIVSVFSCLLSRIFSLLFETHDDAVQSSCQRNLHGF